MDRAEITSVAEAAQVSTLPINEQLARHEVDRTGASLGALTIARTA